MRAGGRASRRGSTERPVVSSSRGPAGGSANNVSRPRGHEQTRPERNHDAPASGRGPADRAPAAFGRVAKPLLVERALYQAVHVGVHADTLPRRAARRIGEMAGRAAKRQRARTIRAEREKARTSHQCPRVLVDRFLTHERGRSTSIPPRQREASAISGAPESKPKEPWLMGRTENWTRGTGQPP
jgi:hypothetical protein